MFLIQLLVYKSIECNKNPTSIIKLSTIISLKQNNKIDRVLMAQLANDRTNIKFDKLNFKLIEKTYEWR